MPPASSDRARMLTGMALASTGAAAFSFITTFSKFAYEAGSTPVTLVLTRSTFFVLAIALIILITRRRLITRPRELAVSFFFGLTGFGMAIGYLSSVAYIPVALAVLILYVNPFVTAILAAATGRERLTLPSVLALLVAFAGIAIAIGPTFEGLDPVGIAFAVTAAVSIGAGAAFGGRLVGDSDPMVISWFANVWMIPMVFIVQPFLGEFLVLPDAKFLWATAGVSIFYVLGYSFWLASLGFIKPTQVGLAVNLEPPITFVSAWFLLGEVLTLSQAIGSAMVLGAIVAMTIYSSRRAGA